MRAFLRSFVWAGKGVALAVRCERNFRFHLCAGFYVFLFSSFYDFGRPEYCLLSILVGGVLALELTNTALERAVDNPSPRRYKAAGQVKDLAAGAVLVFCVGAAACGFFLFWDTAVFAQIVAYFAAHIVQLFLLMASLAAAIWFVFFFPPKKSRDKS